MSTTVLERESQGHHAFSAKGRVLIGGAGMGLLAWNCAIKPEVESVTIVERDASVLRMLEHVAARCHWANWGKVRFIQADMLALVLAERFDVALIDIWQGLRGGRRADMKTIARNIKAERYAGWCQELDFVSWCAENAITPIEPRHWRAYGEAIGVPLILPEDEWNMAARSVLADRQATLADQYTHRRWAA